MTFQDTSSRWTTDSPISFHDGWIRWKSQLYRPVPVSNKRKEPYPWQIVIDWPEDDKVEFPPSFTRAQFRIMTFLFLSMMAGYSTISLLFWPTPFPPARSMIPAVSYMLIPFVVVDFLGRWHGRWKIRREITPFRDFLGPKEEWFKVLKPRLIEHNPHYLAWPYASILAGRQVKVLGMRGDQIKACGLRICVVVISCVLVVESGKFDLDHGLVVMYGLIWLFTLVATYPIGMRAGLWEVINQNVAALRKDCEMSDDEEKGKKKESVVELKWLVEQLLIDEEDSKERALERRVVIIDPVLRDMCLKED